MGARVHCILVTALAVHLLALVTAQSIGGCLKCCVVSECTTSNCATYVRAEYEGTCYCPQSSTTVTTTPQSSNYYWFGCTSIALTIGASATADLRSGTYSTVNAASSSVITVGSTTLLSTIVVGGNSVYAYNFGTITGIALSSTSSATVSIAASGTVGTITNTGGVVYLTGTGTVVSCVQSGGSITVANGVQAFDLSGSGTFSIASTATAITITTTGTSTIYGTPSLVTIINAGVVVTIGSVAFAATVGTLDGRGAAPAVYVYRSVGSMFSNGVTTVSSGGSITSLTHTGGTLGVSSGATVATFAASGSTSVTVDGTIETSSASSGSSLTFSGAGTVASHQQAGGSVTVASGATVSTLRGSGTFSIGSAMTAVTITGTSTIYGTPFLVTVASPGVVLTVGSASSGATVATLEGRSAAPTVHVYRTVGVLLSNGVTAVHSGGSITSLTHGGGAVTVSSGATVATLSASGSTSVTVDGTIETSSASSGSSLTLSGAGTVTSHQQGGGTLVVSGVTLGNISGFGNILIGSTVTSGVLLFGGASTLLLSGSHNTSVVTLGDVVDSSTSIGNTSFTILKGGTLYRHNVSGGTVAVNNSGGVSVGSLNGYGLFDVVYGAVDTVSTSGSATVVVRSNASVGNLLVGGPNTTIAMEGGGLVSNITLLPSASVVFITLSGRGSAFRALVATQGSLDTLTITVTNNATFGCLDMRSIRLRDFTLRCSGLNLEQRACAFLALSNLAASAVTIEVVDSALNLTDHPVLLLDQQNASSLTATFTRCSLTTRNSDVLQLVPQVAIGRLSVNVTDCVVVAQQSGGLLLINGAPNIVVTEGELHTITRRIAVVKSNVTVDVPIVTCISGAVDNVASGMLDVVVMGGQWTWLNESFPAIAFDAGMSQTATSGDQVWGLASLTMMDVALVVASSGAVLPVVAFRGGPTSSRLACGTVLLSNVSLTASTALPALSTVSFVHISGAVVLDGASILVARCGTLVGCVQ